MTTPATDTDLSNLRNLLTPLFNLAKLIPMKDKTPELEKLVDDEAKQCGKNMPIIRDLLTKIEQQQPLNEEEIDRRIAAYAKERGYDDPDDYRFWEDYGDEDSIRRLIRIILTGDDVIKQ